MRYFITMNSCVHCVPAKEPDLLPYCFLRSELILDGRSILVSLSTKTCHRVASQDRLDHITSIKRCAGVKRNSCCCEQHTVDPTSSSGAASFTSLLLSGFRPFSFFFLFYHALSSLTTTTTKTHNISCQHNSTFLCCEHHLLFHTLSPLSCTPYIQTQRHTQLFGKCRLTSRSRLATTCTASSSRRA